MFNKLHSKKSFTEKYGLFGVLLAVLVGGVSYAFMRRRVHKNLLEYEPQWEEKKPVMAIHTETLQTSDSLGVQNSEELVILPPESHDEGLQEIKDTDLNVDESNKSQSGKRMAWEFPDTVQLVEQLHHHEEDQVQDKTNNLEKWGLIILGLITLIAVLIIFWKLDVWPGPLFV